VKCHQNAIKEISWVNAAVAYLIAFSSGWKMTLVVTASIPLLVVAGGIQASVMTGFSSQVQTLNTNLATARHLHLPSHQDLTVSGEVVRSHYQLPF
jgi:hypothetical protein